MDDIRSFNVNDIPEDVGDDLKTEVVGSYQKDDDVYVLCLLAQGDYLAKNGKGITNDSIPKYYKRFNDTTHTASSSIRDHPYFTEYPSHLIQNATHEEQANWYKDQATKVFHRKICSHFLHNYEKWDS